jgi:hypothetical protein
MIRGVSVIYYFTNQINNQTTKMTTAKVSEKAILNKTANIQQVK